MMTRNRLVKFASRNSLLSSVRVTIMMKGEAVQLFRTNYCDISAKFAMFSRIFITIKCPRMGKTCHMRDRLIF